MNTRHVKLSLKNISYSFGKQKAVDNFSLDVEEGSFTTLLGPSGCGKTTLLRLITGFLEPDSGEILIDGIDQKGIEVNDRKVGIVFQDYALFPHLTVRQNLLYGLKANKKSFNPDDFSRIITETTLSLGIEDLLSRYPHELSGGQQQRVALGRALVLKPKILLMDEPLSSLDTKLRTKVRDELREIQQKLKITTVYVTHDQEEALSLSTKIAIINKGNLQQEGSPREIYFQPKNSFVADFVGKANIIKYNDKNIIIRPEWLKITSAPHSSLNQILPENTILLTGTILSEQFLGSKTRFIIQTNNTLQKEAITADFDTITCENLLVGDQITLTAVKSWEI